MGRSLFKTYVTQDFDWLDTDKNLAHRKFTKNTYLLGIRVKSIEEITTHDMSKLIGNKVPGFINKK